MNNKLQKYLAIGVVALVVVLIALKLFTNYKATKLNWEEVDRAVLIDQCIEDLAGRSITFPSETKAYCECSTDTLMQHFKKAEYNGLYALSKEERREKILRVVLECYNNYQEGMFDESTLD